MRRPNKIPKLGEHKSVQARIFEYAKTLGLTFVSREESKPRYNLIQTISQVNRKFKNKKKGLVVDYIGIKKQMNLALAHPYDFDYPEDKLIKLAK